MILRDQIITSLYSDRTIIKFAEQKIIIEKLPNWAIQAPVVLMLFNKHGDCVCKENRVSQVPHIFNVGKLLDGGYTLKILYKVRNLFSVYSDINNGHGFDIEVSNGVFFAAIPDSFINNIGVYTGFSSRNIDKTNCSQAWPTRFIPQKVRDLSMQLTRGCTNAYKKCLVIHDWVANNIYYDRDSLINDRYQQTNNDSLAVLNSRKTVCGGYSNLTQALLISAGVYAINLECYACGEGESNFSDQDDNILTKDANHVMTAAFADDRWILMDVTWDSDNVYEEGLFKQRTGRGTSRQYFDCSIAFISYTHKFIK